MEKELIRLLLQNSFWEENKDRILKEFFPSNLYPVVTLINELQAKYHKDITVGELKAVYKVNNPTITRAQWDFLEEILDNLPVEISQDVAKECIQKAYITETARKLAQIGIDGINGQEINIEKIRALLTALEQGEFLEDELTAVSSELEDILDAINVTTKWKFNIRTLEQVASGVGDGIFTIIGGRPEAGKSCLAISLSASPGGFADQGGLVHYYANEEGALRLQGRAYMSFTGMTLQEILLNPDIAKKKYLPIKEKLKFFDCRDKSIYEIGKHIAKHNPSISIFDQLDKLSINGTYVREDERLGALYSTARDMGNKYACAIIGITQLNAESEGKTYISSANLSNARTAKAAEGDLVFGIGKSPAHTEETRIINIIKNKILGFHQEVVCQIRPQISRYVA